MNQNAFGAVRIYNGKGAFHLSYDVLHILCDKTKGQVSTFMSYSPGIFAIEREVVFMLPFIDPRILAFMLLLGKIYIYVYIVFYRVYNLFHMLKAIQP